MELNPYLTFDGTCEAALTFYAEVLGGRITMLSRFSELPDMEFPPGSEDRVAHARLEIGAQTIMASDSFPGQEVRHGGFSMQTGWDDVDAARAAFERISAGGEVTMAFEPTFWAKGFGLCKDRFGVPWMMNCDAEEAP